MKKIAIIGCGGLGRIVAKAHKDGYLPDYELVSALSRKKEDAEGFCQEFGGTAAQNIDELLSFKPDYVIETASVASVREYCLPCLNSGANFIPLSIGAFADQAFYEEAKETARKNSVKLYIPHGAVGAFDVLRTVSLMAEAEKLPITAGISTRKGPKSLQNTPVYQEKMAEEECLAFEGSCQQAIALLPTKVNVAVAQSLATIGPERATAKISSVPGFVGDEHVITAECSGLRVQSSVYSANADIAGWSIVSLLRNLSSPVDFF